MPNPSRSRSMFPSWNGSQSTSAGRSGVLESLPSPALQAHVLPCQELVATTTSCGPASCAAGRCPTSLNSPTPTYVSQCAITGASTAGGVSPAVASSMAAGNKTLPLASLSPVLASRVVHSVASPAPVSRESEPLHTGCASVTCVVSDAIRFASSYRDANVSPCMISRAVSVEVGSRQTSAPGQASADCKLINSAACFPRVASPVPAPRRQSVLSHQRPAGPVSSVPACRGYACQRTLAHQRLAGSASPGSAYRGYASQPRQKQFGQGLRETRVVAPQQASSLPDLASPRLMTPQGWQDVVTELRSDQPHEARRPSSPSVPATPPLPRLPPLELPPGNTIPSKERLTEVRADVESKAARQVPLANAVLLDGGPHDCQSALQDACKIKELIRVLEHELILQTKTLAFWKARLTQIECREEMDALCKRWNFSPDGSNVGSSDTTVVCDASVEHEVHEVVNTTTDPSLLTRRLLAIAERSAAPNANNGQHCVDTPEDNN